MPYVEGFRPSVSGLHFRNSFPKIPLVKFTIPGSGGRLILPFGDASKGLCGGMIFTVRDYFEARLAPPPDRTPPLSGPLFHYLGRRLFDSFGLPLAPLRYAYLMCPALPDHETAASEKGIAPHGRAWVMIRDEWPKIKDDLDHGRLSLLGLIKVKSVNLLEMGHNHQVLAYGYDLSGTDLVIHIYDPNAPDDDDATLALSLANPTQITPVTGSTAAPVYCFFRTHYNLAGPPPLGTPLSPDSR